MKSSIFLTLGILAAVHSIPIVINKNKGIATEQTNPLNVDSISEDEYPRIHPILSLPIKEESNNPTSVDEYPQIHLILPLTRDKVPNSAPLKNKPHSVGFISIGKVEDAIEKTNPLTVDSTSEDEYPRIHPILPLPKKEVSTNPSSVDEYPQIHPILPLTRNKLANVVNPSTSAPPLKNKPPSIGLVSISNDDETPVIFKLQPGLSYNQAPPKTQTYNEEPMMQNENMAHNQETFTTQGVKLQSKYRIPIRMNTEPPLTQYQGQYNYSPADTNVEGNQEVQDQQIDSPQYSYEYSNQYPQQDQQNYEYVQTVPASNYYQQPYYNRVYSRPYYTQSEGGYRPQVTTYPLGLSGQSRSPFGGFGSHIQSALHSLFFG